MPSAGVTNPVKGQRKTKVGRVVSDRMDKTIVVSVERLTRHRLYKRVVRASTKFAAHDETNEARIGDTVLIEESRPKSATKRWNLVSVLSRAGEERASEMLLTEEAETTEVMHRGAHGGRHAAGGSGEGAGAPETEPSEPGTVVAAGDATDASAAEAAPVAAEEAQA